MMTEHEIYEWSHAPFAGLLVYVALKDKFLTHCCFVDFHFTLSVAEPLQLQNCDFVKCL